MKKTNFSQKFGQLASTYSTSSKLVQLVWKIDSKLFLASLGAIIVPGVIPFVNIYIYKLVIDEIVRVISGATFDPAVFYPLIGIRILTYFLLSASFQTQDLVTRMLWTKIPIELNQLLFTKISSLDVHYYEDDKFRNQLEKVREARDFHPQRLIENLLFSLQSLIQVVLAFTALAYLNWLFVILIILVAIPEFFLQTKYSKLAWSIWNDESGLKKRFHYLQRMLEGHREHKEMKLFSLAKNFLKEMHSLQFTFYKSNTKLAKQKYKQTILFDVFSTAVFIGIEFYVIYQALNRRLTVGDINFYTGVVSNFQNGLGGLLRNLNAIFDSALYVQTIFDILKVEPIIKEIANPIKFKTTTAPLIEFKNVTFSYPETNQKILQNFSLTIKPGEKVAFVGENGAGKSTVIKLLSRFYDVNEGQILINGINIRDLSLNDWYNHIGVLFQDFNRYEDQVSENIYLGKNDLPKDLEKIISASKLAGSHQMVNSFEKGYDQMLGRMFENGLELSGGQWQKIALARAFFRSAPILVLDEPTSAIDAKAESQIFERVEKLARDKTVIIISHRFSTVRNADKIYVISHGKISESGTHQELLKQDGQYAEMFKVQAKGYQ